MSDEKKKVIKKKKIIIKKIHLHKKKTEDEKKVVKKPVVKATEPVKKDVKAKVADVKNETTTKPTKKYKRYDFDKKFSKFKDDYDDDKLVYHKKKEMAPVSSVPKEIVIMENISVGELAKKLNMKVNALIKKLMELGVMAKITDVIDADTATILCDEFSVKVKVVSLFDETVIKDEKDESLSDDEPRDPVVTVMGHVDHGKTQLLDSLRNANVIETEAGRITQHIGAYKIWVDHDNTKKGIVFLDTPGHEAFTAMRARGADTTDIVILIVAADDGVMAQTVEAINHAKNANVPIIVAINKIDLPAANVDKVKQDLSNYGIVPEEWGGENLIVEISAKQKTNLDKLLDAIILTSELLELKANSKKKGTGVVIESRIDPGLGAVASVLIRNGTLSLGDSFVVGLHAGKARLMLNESGEKMKEAGPSTPVAIYGIDGVPYAGDPFKVTISEKYAKQISLKRKELKKFEQNKNVKKVTLDNFIDHIKDGEILELNLIIKADVKGSVEALEHSFGKLSNEQVRIKVVHSAAGGINENDVSLASASKSVIIGFHTRPNGRAMDLAKNEKVEIRTYDIIYEAIDDVKKAMEGLLEPEIKEEIFGSVEIRDIFKYSKVGTIGGGYVTNGKALRGAQARLVRDGVVIYTGVVSSLKRFKEDAREVPANMECGLMLENYNDLKVGDVVEIFKEVQEKRILFNK